MERQERQLSTYQYFEILQVEWLVADLRCRIFKSEKDQSYWHRVREGKRVKIESIAEKNKLPTIFTDDDLKRDLEHRIYNDFTYPIFHDIAETHKQKQGYWDLLNYYSKGIEVRYEFCEEVKVGRVVDYTPLAKEIRIQCIKTNDIDIALVSKTLRIL